MKKFENTHIHERKNTTNITVHASIEAETRAGAKNARVHAPLAKQPTQISPKSGG